MFNLLAQYYDSPYSSAYSDTYNSANSNSAAGLAIFGGIFMFIIMIILAFYILTVIGMWKIFKKAGQPGWKALIPIYNSWVLFEISGKPGYWALAAFVPFVGQILAMVAWIIAALQLAKKFGKDTTFAVVFLIILPLIGLLILGFGDTKYNESNESDLSLGQPTLDNTQAPSVVTDATPSSATQSSAITENLAVESKTTTPMPAVQSDSSITSDSQTVEKNNPQEPPTN